MPFLWLEVGEGWRGGSMGGSTGTCEVVTPLEAGVDATRRRLGVPATLLFTPNITVAVGTCSIAICLWVKKVSSQ